MVQVPAISVFGDAIDRLISFLSVLTAPTLAVAEALSSLIPISNQPVTRKDEKRRHRRGHQTE